MAWNVWSVDSKTGGDRVRLYPSTMGWCRALNGTGQKKQAVFLLGDPQVRENINWNTTLPFARTLVLDWDGYVAYAGRISARPAYKRSTQTLTLEHEDIWGFFRERHVLADRGEGLAKSLVAHRGYGMGTIARRLVKAATMGGDYALPIDFGPDTAGATNRTYPGYKFTRLDDALQELLDSGHCPDVDFRPYWSSNTNSARLRYEMRVGGLSTDTLTWVTSSQLSEAGDAITDVEIMEDVSRVATQVFGLGEGQGEDMKVASVSRSNSNFPARETTIQMKQNSDADSLLSAAAEELRASFTPTEQHRLTMRVAGSPGIRDLQVGMTARILYVGDPWLPDAGVETRLVQYSGDLTDAVTLDFQPVQEDV